MPLLPAKNGPIDCGLATTSEFSRAFAKQQVSDRTGDIVLSIESRQISEASIAPVTLGDINYLQNTFPVAATDFRATVDFLPEKFNIIKEFVSSDESVLRVSSHDPALFEYQASGTATLKAVFINNETSATLATATTKSDAVKNNFVEFVPNSLGRHIFDQIRQYANNSTSAPQHYSLYSTFNQSNNVYQKNSACWAAALDFSGVTVNKSGTGGTMITAVTPCHAFGVGHAQPSAGDIISFCDANGQTVTRQVESVAGVAGIDFCCVKWSQPLPATVKTYKLLPSTFANYLPVNFSETRANGSTASFPLYYLPAVVCSHYRWDADWVGQRSNRYVYAYQTSGLVNSLLVYAPAQNDPNNFSQYNGNPSNIRGGDSGGPVFFVISGELVLVAMHTTSLSGTFPSAFLTQAQGAVNSTGSEGYSIQTADLSAFTNFAS